MIVTAKPPVAGRQEPRKAAVASRVVVNAKKPGPRPYAGPSARNEPDPEAEARVRAFFSKVLRPPGK